MVFDCVLSHFFLSDRASCHVVVLVVLLFCFGSFFPVLPSRFPSLTPTWPTSCSLEDPTRGSAMDGWDAPKSTCMHEVGSLVEGFAKLSIWQLELDEHSLLFEHFFGSCIWMDGFGFRFLFAVEFACACSSVALEHLCLKYINISLSLSLFRSCRRRLVAFLSVTTPPRHWYSQCKQN